MFGKTQRGVSERPNKPKKPLIPKWLGMLVAILAILCVAVMLMLWQPWQPVPTKTQVTSEHYQEEDTNKDYRFYDLLPQQQVTPIPEQAVPETKQEGNVVIIESPKPETMTTEDSATLTPTEPTAPVAATYILQVRSYPDPDSADARRAEIILNGLSADVVKTVENGQTWYRVFSGPYDSQDAALAAQQTLQHSGIDSIVIKR
ncbi:MAG TPA: cell division protein [Acinetobacter sp.]|uniref:Cell division protein FtsN n=1 Tax=Acinetobacter venetianus TaxID=52133 RepID=A0A150HRQ9_9GAMM|nr:SPOR domain-containing protein [Acinetobacter venetianus]KXZ69392.1 cell division protein FtsN [Acinetobacter venetianus]HBO71324.1 cell division protein [Acinetobacter sp.]HIQ35463.1 SPOR domain-containing protein [Acinetobacter venetianus]HJP47237.1 SPOR domain-containing protein [Acinetobacter venetianus]